MCAPPPPLLHRPSTPAFTAFTAFTTFTSYAASLPSHLLHRRLFHRLLRLLHCRRPPAFLVQDDYIGLFDEVKFPDASKQSNPLATVVSNLATAQPQTSPSGTTAPVSSKEIEERVDLTGGMG